MDDLISREAALDCFNDWVDRHGDVHAADEDTVYQKIEALPSAVRTGKWTTEDCHATTYKYCCSNCKAHHRARYDFCPSCGADMREELWERERERREE